MNAATPVLRCEEENARRAEPALGQWPAGYGWKKDSSKWTGKPFSQTTTMSLEPDVAVYWQWRPGGPSHMPASGDLGRRLAYS